MVKYVLTMLNKIIPNSMINLRILYTEYLWTLQIDPHTRVELIT